MRISLVSASHEIESSACSLGPDCTLILDREYREEDCILFDLESVAPPCFFWVQADAALRPSLLYFTESIWCFDIPSGYIHALHPDRETIFPETAFAGREHVIRIWQPDPVELASQRNLAFNSHDQPKDSGVFPHARDNIKNRTDPTFFACNAIDGYRLNKHHGGFPYQSWGINRDPEAALTLEFGRPVDLNRVVITLRADFPHDSYWTQGNLSFSDGSNVIVPLSGTDKPQTFDVEKARVSTLRFSDLVKAADSSPFPALTEIEVFGQENAGVREHAN